MVLLSSFHLHFEIRSFSCNCILSFHMYTVCNVFMGLGQEIKVHQKLLYNLSSQFHQTTVTYYYALYTFMDMVGHLSLNMYAVFHSSFSVLYSIIPTSMVPDSIDYNTLQQCIVHDRSNDDQLIVITPTLAINCQQVIVAALRVGRCYHLLTSAF